MKKYLILILLALMPVVSAKAQIVGKSSDPNVEFVIKRVTDMGNGSFRINLLITNHGKDDLSGVYFANDSIKCQAYDDEGKTYSADNWNCSDGARSWRFFSTDSFVLPSEVPIRFLIDINDVNEFATKFLRLDIGLFSSTSYNYFYVKFKNIPLPRKQ